jgi:hypothetical protein
MKIEIIKRDEEAEIPYELVRETHNNGKTYLAVRPLIKKDAEDVPLFEKEEVTEVIDNLPKKKAPAKKEKVAKMKEE